MDAHIHFREGAMLKVVVPHTVQQWSRAVVMPNLSEPIFTLDRATQYHEEIMAATSGKAFEALMTMYLSPEIKPQIEKWDSDHVVQAVKMYPKGGTTNSEAGVSDIEEVFPVLELMEEKGMKLLIHGEVADNSVDVFDRERRWVDTGLLSIVKRFPRLKIVCEHITTREMVAFIQDGPSHIGATITPQHLLHDRNIMLGDGIRPHWYCKPILKRKEDQEALLSLVCSDLDRVFAGTDSAPHLKKNNESDCGCAGVYSAPCALSMYVTALSQRLDLSRGAEKKIVERFLSINGPVFYGREPSSELVVISNDSFNVPQIYDVDGEILNPILAGESLQWSVKSV